MNSRIQFKDEDNFFLVVKKSVHLLTSTIKSLKNLDQILLIPLIIWSGAEQSFIGAHFTKVTQSTDTDRTLFVLFYLIGICVMHVKCKIHWSRFY